MKNQFLTFKRFFPATLKGNGVKSLCVFLMLMLCTPIFFESCRSNRRGRGTRERDRVEAAGHYKNRSQKDNSKSASTSGKEYSESYLQSLAQGDDYDAMLNCLQTAVKELNSVKNEYFAGKLSDNEAEDRIDNIMSRYQPVIDSLGKASDEGKLNYNQHKKQMKLAGDLLNIISDASERMSKDFYQSLR